MSHVWSHNEVLPEREVRNDDGEVVRIIPPFVWFTKCVRCGCLVTSGKSLLFRATPTSEWTDVEPNCGVSP